MSLPVLAEARETDRFKTLLRDSGVVDDWQRHGWPSIRTSADEGFDCR